MNNYKHTWNKWEIKSKQGNRKYKEEPHGKFRTVNTVTEVNTEWMGSTVEWKREERISELEGRTIEITTSEHQRENGLKNLNKNKNRASGICRSITKDLTLCQKNRKSAELKKVLKEIMD